MAPIIRFRAIRSTAPAVRGQEQGRRMSGVAEAHDPGRPVVTPYQTVKYRLLCRSMGKASFRAASTWEGRGSPRRAAFWFAQDV
jgi:hypothetical protein